MTEQSNAAAERSAHVTRDQGEGTLAAERQGRRPYAVEVVDGAGRVLRTHQVWLRPEDTVAALARLVEWPQREWKGHP